MKQSRYVLTTFGVILALVVVGFAVSIMTIILIDNVFGYILGSFLGLGVMLAAPKLYMALLVRKLRENEKKL